MGIHFLSKYMTNILVPKVFGFAKIFRFTFFSAAFFSAILLPILRNVIKILMTSHTSLKTLIFFKTSFMILNKLGSFYLVSMSLASYDVRCLGTE